MRITNVFVILLILLSLSICGAHVWGQAPAHGEGPEKGKALLISMDFQDVNLGTVLKVLSEQSGLNFVAGENVKDIRVTVYLNKVTVEDALRAILIANGLTYEVVDGAGVVSPAR